MNEITALDRSEALVELMLGKWKRADGILEQIKGYRSVYITLPLYRLDLVTFKEFLDGLGEILDSYFTTKDEEQ